MSVVGRLWRRAPAWRLSLMAALTCTGLAAMFPPHVPALHWPWAGAAVDRPARYRPETGPVPIQPSLFHLELPHGSDHGVFVFAGRQVPLPAGTWQELGVGRAGGPERMQIVMLDRVEGHRLTGLIQLAAPSPSSNAVGTVELPAACIDPDSIAHGLTTAPPGQSPLAHECWALGRTDLSRVATDKHGDPFLQHALAGLAAFHVAYPPAMLALDFERSDDTGWLSVNILLPDGPSAAHRLAQWAPRFQVPLHKGYDHTLTPADLPASLAQDPS